MTVSGLALGYVKKYESTTVGRQEIILRICDTQLYIYLYIEREGLVHKKKIPKRVWKASEKAVKNAKKSYLTHFQIM